MRFKNAEGKEYRYFYTRRGKLKAVVNEKGRVVEYRLDADGNAVSTKRYWLEKGAEAAFGKIAYRLNTSQEQEASFLKIAYRRNVQRQDRTVFNCRDLGLNDRFTSNGPLTSGYDTRGFTPVDLPSCGDSAPFGPMGGNNLNPRFNSFFFRQDETCSECKDRHRKICRSEFHSCTKTHVLGGAAGGAVVGGAIVGTGGYLKCDDDENTCILGIPDKCKDQCKSTPSPSPNGMYYLY